MKKIIFAFAILLLSACEGKKGEQALSWQVSGQDTMYVCHTHELGSTRKVNLSEWVKDFEAVQLENLDTALMRGWKTYVTDNYILQQDERMVKLFDRQGKYLCDVGKYGQGPGEYQMIYSCAIDEKLNRICLLPFNSPKLLEYDLQGKFIRSENTPMIHKGIARYQSDSTLVITHLQFKETPSFQYLTVNTSGQKTYIKDTRMTIPSRDKDGGFIGYNGEIWLNSNASFFSYNLYAQDTLYNFIPEEQRTYQRLVMEEFGGRAWVMSESSDAFFIHFSAEDMNNRTTWMPKAISIIIDKRKNEAYYAEVVNDFVGGLPTNGLPFCRGGWFIQSFEPLVLLDMIEEHLTKGDCTDEDRIVLERLIDTMDDNGNNILFIGELKE